MTPQELKNSILQRAIEGRLVEQRAEEGTGAELFDKIQKEKKELIREGKIKKQKSLEEIKKDEIPFDIPETWKWVRLGDVGEWAAGSTPLRTNLEFYGGEIPWLKTGDLNDGFITDVPEYITDLALSRTSLKLNPAGSVLIAMYGATIGKLGILKKPMTTNQACCACQPLDGIYNLYLFYFLMSSRRRLIKMAEGGAQPNISRTKIIGLTMPLPPLAEQKRIVEKIEELMPLVDEYEKNWQKLEEFNQRFPEDMKKSLLQEAIKGKLVEQRKEEGTGTELFGKIQKEKKELIKEGKIKNQKPLPEITEDEIPFDIPETWKWVRLGEIIDFKMGKTPPRAELQWWKPQVPWVSIADMQEDGIITRTKEGISNEALEEKFSNSISQKGTLLMSFKLTVGRVSILGIDAVHNEAIISIYPIVDSEDIFKSFLFKILPFITKFGETKNAIKGKTLNSTSINNLILPLPPLAEQKRIVDRLEELLPLCDKLIKNKEK